MCVMCTIYTIVHITHIRSYVTQYIMPMEYQEYILYINKTWIN